MWSLSCLAVLGRARVRVQPQAARHDGAGNIGQPPVMSVCVGTQPDKGLRDADAELLGEHSGGLIDLGAVQGQVQGRSSRAGPRRQAASRLDRKSTRLNSSHVAISYAVFCLKKKKK